MSAPYGGYAYAPGYGGPRYWDGPAGYDTGGMAYSYRELGVQPGPWTGLPPNPCYSGSARAEPLLATSGHVIGGERGPAPCWSPLRVFYRAGKMVPRASRSSAPCRMYTAAC